MATKQDVFNGTGDDDSEHWSEVADWLLDHEEEEIDVTFINREVLEELKK
jgi:hypothetical protein